MVGAQQAGGKTHLSLKGAMGVTAVDAALAWEAMLVLGSIRLSAAWNLKCHDYAYSWIKDLE